LRYGCWTGGPGNQWIDGATDINHVAAARENGVVTILVAYHILEKVGNLFAELWKGGSKRAKQAFVLLCGCVAGCRPKMKPKPKPRTGEKKARTICCDKKYRFPEVGYGDARELGPETRQPLNHKISIDLINCTGRNTSAPAVLRLRYVDEIRPKRTGAPLPAHSCIHRLV